MIGHINTVIQKYLRNDYGSIRDYNLAADEVAEAFRFLVIFDFPANFNNSALDALVKIIHNGPRCGVFTLLVRNTAKPSPYGFNFDAELRPLAFTPDQQQPNAPSPTVVDWNGVAMTSMTLILDQPPEKEIFDAIIRRAASTAKKADADSVLPFDKLLRLGELDASSWWKSSTAKAVEAPIGQSGARGVQRLVFGEGTAHHALLVGQTGSGKTNLMHVLITTLALNYSPDEIELYLIDFKGGVGFKQYATCRLPQARVIAIQSEREFGLSVLDGLEAELKRRFDLFRSAGVENLTEYRAKTSEKMPRLLLIVDEFQEFFQPQDDLAQQARSFFDRIVRQGRAFGIHILLATQSLSGTAALPSSTQEQMGIRIVLQCSENDAE